MGGLLIALDLKIQRRTVSHTQPAPSLPAVIPVSAAAIVSNMGAAKWAPVDPASVALHMVRASWVKVKYPSGCVVFRTILPLTTSSL